MIRDFNSLKQTNFDLLVIGGGIYGAWTAYEAALCGLKVALVEKNDWASGNSSASTKLIHGGLRYLEHFHFRLVKKSLLERKRLMKLSPHRVLPLRFIIPVYESGDVSSIYMRIGLGLYDFLARDGEYIKQHEYLARDALIKKCPALDDKGLKEGITYGDCQTDDARFVLEIVSGALHVGVSAVNYTEALHFIDDGDKVTGARVRDGESGEIIDIHATSVFNAAGASVNHISEGQYDNIPIRLTKGVHLIMPQVLHGEALLILAKRDGRVFFMVPWYGKTMVGTTDTDYSGSRDNVTVDEEDIDYLLTESNHVLKGISWGEEDILGSFAGVRVLQDNPDALPSSVSREHAVIEQRKGLFASIGGKFTSARNDAVKIVDMIVDRLGKKGLQRNCTADKPFPWSPTVEYPQWRDSVLQEGMSLNLDRETIEWGMFRYGSKISELFSIIRQTPKLADPIIKGLPFCQAEIVYCASHEMVIHLEDLLRRRIPVIIMHTMTRSVLKNAAKLVAPILGWSAQQKKNEIQKVVDKWKISG
jgi:glycerol-3-phosphate dehydrogenase